MTNLFRNSSPNALTREQAVALEKKRMAERRRQRRQAEELAAQGRGGDTELAHVTVGEIVLPDALQTPAVLDAIRQAALEANIPLEQLRVGSALNSINPQTGQPEFFEPSPDFTRNFAGVSERLQNYDFTGSPVGTDGLYNGPINIGRQLTNPAHVNAFFDAHDKAINDLANEMNVPPNYLLGLSAHESGWGQKNNLFGRGNAAEQPYQYDKPDTSIDAFRNSQWFSRLQNKKGVDDFLNALVDPKGGVGVYNKHDGYTDLIRNSIDTINRRRPIWEQTR